MPVSPITMNDDDPINVVAADTGWSDDQFVDWFNRVHAFASSRPPVTDRVVAYNHLRKEVEALNEADPIKAKFASPHGLKRLLLDPVYDPGQAFNYELRTLIDTLSRYNWTTIAMREIGLDPRRMSDYVRKLLQQF